MKTLQRNILTLLLLCFCLSAASQANGLMADITTYGYTDYFMSPVNTCIDINGLEAVYMGSANGVARFNGNTWSRLSLPTTGKVYAVCALGNSIFVGGSRMLGVMHRVRGNSATFIDMTRMVRKLCPYEFSVRSIEGYNNKDVYVATSIGAMHYDGRTLQYLQDITTSSKRLLKTTGRHRRPEIFVQDNNGTLYSLSQGKSRLRCMDREIQCREVVMVEDLTNGLYAVATSDGCLFTLSANGTLKEMLPQEALYINSGALSRDGRFLALGTLGDGLHVIDLLSGEEKRYGADRLGSMNVSEVAFTQQGQLWVALDCSAASITFNPMEFLWLPMLEYGVLLDALTVDGTIYMTTSTGLFAAASGEVRRCTDTHLVPTSLCQINGQILIGTIGPILRFDHHNLTQLSTGGRIEGCAQMVQWGSNLLMVRAFGGVFLLERQAGGWHAISNPVGDGDLRRVEFESSTVFWTADIHHLTRVTMDRSLRKVTDRLTITNVGGVAVGRSTFLVRWKGMVLCINRKGVFAFDRDRHTMVRNDMLSNMIGSTSGDILAADTEADGNPQESGRAGDKLWLMRPDRLECYNASGLMERRINLAGIKPLEYYGVYHFCVLNDRLLLLATSRGTMRFDLTSGQAEASPGQLRLETVSYLVGDSLRMLYVDDARYVRLPTSASHIVISMTNGLSVSPMRYSYSIDGGKEMTCQSSGTVSIDLLPYGKHHLRVTDNFGHSVELVLARDWPLLLSWYMIVLYLIMIVAMVALVVVRIQTRKRQRLDREMAATQRALEEELRRRENEQMRSQIQAQDSQLKERMRFLTMKQDILNSLTTEIEAQKKEIGDKWPERLYRRIMDLIQRSRTEEDHLLSFENYFVDVHRNFMEGLQQEHPELTSGELRFCCLLKANLSTKEIASMLSITPRSVDLKKYRLKKKLGLGENDSLTTFIAAMG